MPNMGIMMAQTLVSSLVISVFVGYLAWHALPPAADYLEVFRITGTATFILQPSSPHMAVRTRETSARPIVP